MTLSTVAAELESRETTSGVATPLWGCASAARRPSGSTMVRALQAFRPARRLFGDGDHVVQDEASAVGVNRLPDDVGRVVAGEKGGHARDLRRLAAAADGGP